MTIVTLPDDARHFVRNPNSAKMYRITPLENLMQTIKPLLLAVAFLASAPVAITANAQGMDHGNMGGMNMPGTKTEGMDMRGMKMESMAPSATEGEVRKVDKAAGKITLKHGDIKNLEMPGMTMVFQVKDAALLDKVKAGDKVRFMADKADGAIVVTSIELAP